MTKAGKIVAIGAGVIISLGTVIYLATRAKAAPGRRSPCPPIGDLDGDGYVTQNDLALLYDVIGRYPDITDEELLRADVNGDGVVNALDITTMELFLEEQIDTFPACGLPWVTLAVFEVGTGQQATMGTPVQLTPGVDYTLVATVTNRTTLAGEPAPAALTVVLTAQLIAGNTLEGFTQTTVSQVFGPGETQSFSLPFYAPAEAASQDGEVRCDVYDPNGVLLASVSLPTRTEYVLVEAATITEITVIGYGPPPHLFPPGEWCAMVAYFANQTTLSGLPYSLLGSYRFFMTLGASTVMIAEEAINIGPNESVRTSFGRFIFDDADVGKTGILYAQIFGSDGSLLDEQGEAFSVAAYEYGAEATMEL